MDDRLQKAIDISNLAATINNQKNIAKAKLADDLAYYIDGCKFTASINFIGSLYALANSGTHSALLQDDNGQIYEVSNIEEFANTLFDINQTALRSYQSLVGEMKQVRSLETLVAIWAVV